MKRKIVCFLLAMVLCLCCATPAFAVLIFGSNNAHPPRVVDEAELLTSGEESALTERLNTLSEQYQLDVAVVTVNTLEGKSPRAFADDYFDYNGYGMGENDDGVLLLVSMEDSDWYITTHGYGIQVFTDAGIEYIGSRITDYLSSEDYADAFAVFADDCEAFIIQAQTGDPYDYHNLPKQPFEAGMTLVITVGIGFVIALMVTGVMKGQLKSVKKQSAAGDYVVRGSMAVTEATEMFLYRNVNRVRKQTSSSGGSGTHRSSSGRTHGGGGGKF